MYVTHTFFPYCSYIFIPTLCIFGASIKGGESRMKKADITFFEEYKKLDKLCGDKYSFEKGVSGYIEKMESIYREGEAAVSVWKYEYKTLKHLRWVRNRIAHTASTERICEKQDIKQVRELYGRILKNKDALALYEKAHKTRSDVKSKARKDAEESFRYKLFFAIIILSLAAAFIFGKRI